MTNDYPIKNYIDESTVDKMVNRLLPIYEHLPSEEGETNNDLADMQEITRETLYSPEFEEMWDDALYHIDYYINANDILTPERIHKECNPTDNILNRLNNAAVAPPDFSDDDYWKQITSDLNPTPARTAELFGTAIEVECFRIIEECVNKYAVERQQELQQMKPSLKEGERVKVDASTIDAPNAENEMHL